MYSVCQWKKWLDLQFLGGPKESSYGFILQDFEEPHEWVGARMFLRDLWSFAFSEMYFASESSSITFSVVSGKNTRYTKAQQLDVGRAVFEGLNYDLVPEEYRLIVTPMPKYVLVSILNPLEYQDVSEPGEDGIIWQWP